MMAGTLPTVDNMLDTLIATPSVSSVNADLDMGNRAISELLADWLETLQFQVQLMPVPGHADKCNVIAVRGAGEDGLILAGHTDTVPYDKGSWSHDPFCATRSSGRLYGLGSSDMKSFFALLLEALRDTRAADQKQPVVVLATADEESGMAGARQLVATDTRPGRYVLIGEPTGLQPVRAHKGIFMLRITLTGRSGHSSDPSLGRSALEGMYQVVGALSTLRNELQSSYRDERFAVPVPTLNFGRIAGGDNPNRICAHCELDIDVRLTPGMDLAATREAIETCVRKVLAGSDLKVSCHALFDGVPPLDTPSSSTLVRRCETLTDCTAGSVSFATEAPLFAALGMEAVIMGPGNIAVAHQPDEYLELASIAPTVRHLRALYQQFCIASESSQHA